MPNLASQMRTAFSSMVVKHRLKIAGRAADDLKHLRRGRLLPQGDSSAARLSSRAFSMAMTAWAAKFVTSAICLSCERADLAVVIGQNAPIEFVLLAPSGRSELFVSASSMLARVMLSAWSSKKVSPTWTGQISSLVHCAAWV